MAISEGDKLPDANFMVRSPSGLDKVSSGDVFNGRKVVVFAVPGAFTPTCNDNHLPSYLEKRDEILGKGVDEIVCVAVNDAFVLDAWAKSTGAAGKIRVLSDGNGDFTKAIGLDFDGSGFGLGTRSMRYAMVVDDGIVKHLAVEEAPPAMEVSGAEHTLAKL